MLKDHRFKLMRQMSTADCAAASLAMVLHYHGVSFERHEISRALSVGRDGANAATILRVAKFYGLSGHGVSIDLEQLSSLPPASILHWNFNHFVVLRRVRKGIIELLDPGRGAVSINTAEANRSFTGVAIFFDPLERKPGSAAPSKHSAYIFKHLAAELPLIVRLVSISFIAQLCLVVTPVLTALVVDRVIPYNNTSLLQVLFVVYVVFQVFAILVTFVRSNIMLYFRTALDKRITLGFLEHLTDLPFAFFQEHTAGDLLTRLGASTSVREILSTGMLSAVIDGSMTAVYFCMLMFVNLRIASVLLLLAVTRLLLMLSVRWRQAHFIQAGLSNNALAQTQQIELLGGMETLKAMGLEKMALDKWTSSFLRGLQISLEQGRLDALSTSALSIINACSSILLLFYGARLVMDGTLTLGELLALSTLAAGFLSPLNNLVSTAAQMQLLGVYLERIQDVMSTEVEDKTVESLVPLRLKGQLALREVTFRYTASSPAVLTDISVVIEQGQRVAIVGRSGCGKSTLARIIAGLYTPASGVVLYDGHDLQSLSTRDLRRQLGIVTQETQLFGATIQENIVAGAARVGMMEVRTAAMMAEVHNDVLLMPLGYNTFLSDRGMSLSGGQRQRIAIARAIAARPALLILDEATSSLDAMTEARVVQQLKELKCTQVLIAHRISTIRDADKIIVLEDGRVIQQGTHEQLLSVRGLYRDLANSQLGLM